MFTKDRLEQLGTTLKLVAASFCRQRADLPGSVASFPTRGLTQDALSAQQTLKASSNAEQKTEDPRGLLKVKETVASNLSAKLNEIFAMKSADTQFLFTDKDIQALQDNPKRVSFRIRTGGQVVPAQIDAEAGSLTVMGKPVAPRELKILIEQIAKSKSESMSAQKLYDQSQAQEHQILFFKAENSKSIIAMVKQPALFNSGGKDFAQIRFYVGASPENLDPLEPLIPVRETSRGIEATGRLQGSGRYGISIRKDEKFFNDENLHESSLESLRIKH